MYKLTKLISLLAVFGLVLTGGYAYAQAAWVYTSPMNPNVYTADYLIGHMVYGLANYELGQITDFVVDQTNGRIALVVLSDVPCFGSEKVAIPFGLLMRDQGGALKINFPEDAPIEMFGNASFPCEYREAMKPGVLHGTVDTAWVDNVYRQYGYAPYWTESGGERTMSLYRCDRLMGADLHIRGTDQVVRVDDFVIEPDGHISYVIFSDIPGRDRDYFVAVPFALVKGDDANACIVDITTDQLASAPVFHYDTDLGSRVYVERVYTYYGVHPYWTVEIEP